MSDLPSLTSALALTDNWPVNELAAAVVTPAGLLASTGDLSHRFALASVSKPLAALGCLVAVEEGTIDLDEPAGPRGPEGVTVRHLLAHAAGYAFDNDLVQVPGRRRIYSNVGFDVLADHLTIRSGIMAADYVSEAVFTSLDLIDTRFEKPSLAHGVWSTVADLAVVALELFCPTIISAATLDEAVRVQFGGLDGVVPGFGRQSPNDWGLGFEIRGHKSPHWTGATNSPATFGHFGAAGTFMWVDPSVGHALIVLTDRPFGRWAAERWPVLSDAVVTAATSVAE